MNTLDKQTLFAFYGTLRKGQGNYRYFLAEKPGAEYLGTTIVPGYDMYSLGGYPMIAKSTEDKSITVDLFKVTDPRIKGGIDGMELGAGYSREEVVINGETYWIYTNNESYYPKTKMDSIFEKVESGDWVSFKTKPKVVNETI